MLPAVKIKIPKKKSGKLDLPAPQRPRLESGTEPELLQGSVSGMKASMPEERFANALNKLGLQYTFRYTIGAPRGMPGWKELDFLVVKGGMLYAFEVDTAFTHRDKGRSDVLHDALVLKELEKLGMDVYPQVIHVDGESDLATQDNSDKTAKRVLQ